MHLCFLVLAKVCANLFIKKEVVCLFLAFIDNMFFSITQPSNSVNLTLSVGKNDMGLIQKISVSEKSNKNRVFTFSFLT